MPTLDLPTFLPFRLNQLAADVSRQLAQAYEERFGIDVPQWRVLATLVDRDSATAQEIVESTRTHKSTISRAVQALTDRGLVSSAQHGEDGRSRRLALTPNGRAMTDEIVPLARGYERDLMARLDPQAAAQLREGLAALEAALKGQG
ncbi:MAG: MarR family winged helix-turn-helix transcriptional regulator [Mesorhizobium sp.]